MIQLSSSDSFAVYRLPGEMSYTLILQEAGGDSDEFFLIGDFRQRERSIRADAIYMDVEFSFVPHECAGETKDISMANYVQVVARLVSELKEGACRKVVLSRTHDIDNSGESVLDIYITLCGAYPDAMVYLYHTPEGGCWMGATPELLMCAESDTKYVTMALAGTQISTDQDIDSVVWGAKEKEEQQYLVDFVEETLQSKDIMYRKMKTRTLDTGAVMHICTDFVFEDVAVDFVETARSLHPGPAISGYPVDRSLEMITHYESEERRDYCGYLGPVGIRGKKALYINLRCMTIYSDVYRLYIGGGITSASDPEEEWRETEQKANTLRRYLSNQH